MPSNETDLVAVLRTELGFLEGGGYRSAPFRWRPPLLLEDSPTCPRGSRGRTCLGQSCPWRAFVPSECQEEDIPCRHIVVGNRGESIDVLYRTASPEEYEESFRNWLLAAIGQLNRPAA